MGAFSELDLMGAELHSKLGMRVFQNEKGEWVYRAENGITVPAHSCEAAILHLRAQCDRASTQDGTGFSGYDADFGHSLAEGVLRYGAFSQKQLSVLQRTKSKDGKNGLISKYSKHLEAAGFYIPALLNQTPVVKDKQNLEFTITVEVLMKSESGRGVKVKQLSTGTVDWLPTSQVKIDGDKVTIPAWLWEDKSFEQELDIHG